MPRLLKLSALQPSLKKFVRPLAEPLPRNPAALEQSPHDFFASLPQDQIPPNVRIQPWIGRLPKLEGVSRVDLHGGKKAKDYGKESREGQGRLARKKGGLLWALRER